MGSYEGLICFRFMDAGVLQQVEGLSVFYCDAKNDVITLEQSTTAHEDRLTQSEFYSQHTTDHVFYFSCLVAPNS